MPALLPPPTSGSQGSLQTQNALRHYDRKPTDKKFQILVCGGTGCTSSGSQAVRDAFHQAI